MADQGVDRGASDGEAAGGGWAVPGARQDPPRYGERVPEAAVPGFAPPATGLGTQVPATGGPTGGPLTANTYVPPPRPGLFPLYPMSFGRLLGSSFQVIRWAPAATVIPALLVQLLTTAILLGGGAAIGFTAVDRLNRATDADRGAIVSGTVVSAVLGFLVLFAVSLIGSALLQGAVATVVARGALGEHVRLGAALRSAARSLGQLVAYAILIGLAQLLTIGFVAGLVALIAVTGTAGVIIAIVVGVLGGLGLVALYVWIGVKLSLVPSAIVLERRNVFGAIGRSWRIVRGSFWRTLGLILLVNLIVTAAVQIVGIPFSILGGVVVGLLAPNGAADTDVPAQFGITLLSSVPSTIVGALVGGIGAIAQVAALVLVFLDLRMRREGLDLELRERMESGTTTGDPFAAPPGT